MIIQASGLIGNLVGSLLIKQLSQTHYFLLMVGVISCISFLYLFIKNVDKEVKNT